MKGFPYRLLFICIFFPPICYILTLYLSEEYLRKHETSRLNDIIIQNYEALYEGRNSLKEEINRNIGDYLLKQDLRFKIGIRTNIQVKTKDNIILYPSQIEQNMDNIPAGHSIDKPNYVDVAAENYRILNDGLILSVSVNIKHNGWLSNSVLLFYVFLALFIIRQAIKKRISESERLEKEYQESIKDLSDKLKERESGLSEIKKKEGAYLSKIEELKKERKNLSTDVDGLLEEIEKLEAGLDEQRRVREAREIDILNLREEINNLRSRFERPEKKIKEMDAIQKRFRVLYKNLSFTERALDGFLSLSDEFQLKAEEIIHRLNDDDSKVPVKRKVFGKGGKMNFLELEFSYSGRIYYRKDSQSRIRIFVIGTKKTQEQDLAFLERQEA
jgi:ABC-type multidrug transport system fused ATPase/permease subunit